MKRIIFVLVMSLLPCFGFAQKPVHADSAANNNLQIDTTIADHGEAGGIDATQIATDTTDKDSNVFMQWLPGVAIGLIVGLVVGLVIKKSKKPNQIEETKSDSKLFIDESVTPQGATKTLSAADIKKLKEEIKSLKLQLDEAKGQTQAYKTNLDVYTDFDQKYYNEAFRKLVSPMNDAMEKGSRKEILESLLKIMSQFSSLTRYKIAKKQPYDEANMQYLMNQRMKNDVAIDIDANTPIDKIPKNIKTLIDMLSEQSSKGLDDSIISGYKIKNL